MKKIRGYIPLLLILGALCAFYAHLYQIGVERMNEPPTPQIFDSGADIEEELVPVLEIISEPEPAPIEIANILTMEATAYTWTGDRTATGTWPSRGTVAVDPSVIPMGTKLHIEGYGEAIAADTGGAIKGEIIDLYMDSEDECRQWGRQRVEVRVIN